MRDAACAVARDYSDNPKYEPGFDPFFPRRGEAAQAIKEARIICESCPVIAACDEYRRLTGSKFGIWAGKLYNPESV